VTHQGCDGETIYPEGLNGEKICSKCGLVIGEAPPLRHFMIWSPEWNSNWDEQDSETIKEWLTILRAISCQLNVPSFPYREEAARMIRKQNKLISRSQKLSKNKRATAAALIHLVLKEYGKNRSMNEIAKQLRIDNKSILKQAWVLKKTINDNDEKSQITQRKTATDYLHEYAGKTTTNNELIFDAEKTLIKIKRSGGNPIGLAAGAFYNSCKKNKAQITKEKIGEIFKISPRTVYSNEARIRKQLTNQGLKISTLPNDVILSARAQ
jgi:transcription initiation factor TFIIIB Brf1 subunit/transcription initiation factor TFIIB